MWDDILISPGGNHHINPRNKKWIYKIQEFFVKVINEESQLKTNKLQIPESNIVHSSQVFS